MPASMKDIKLRIKSVQGTMQITKAMELVASSKLRRARQRVEHSRPYFETLYRALSRPFFCTHNTQKGAPTGVGTPLRYRRFRNPR